MNRYRNCLLLIPLAFPLACDEPDVQPEPIQAAAVTTEFAAPGGEAIDEHLLASLPGRRSWSARKVKLDLERPDLRVELSNPSGRRAIVDAWAGQSSDLRVPVVRVDFSDRLYEVTATEWQALQRRASRS